MQEQYKVSIIIPHYNSPHLLERLLESIPKREDYQIIVVDDNSTKHQNKLEQCRNQYASENSLFLTNTTGKNSAGTCRNIGTQYATGKWLMYADADDVFLPNLNTIIQPYLETDADIVFFKPVSYDFTNEKISDRHQDMAKLVENYLEKQSLETELRLRYFHVCPWSKLIRRSMVERNKIFFDSTIVSNDIMFSTQCGHYAKQIIATQEQIYCVTKTEGSLTTQSSEKNYDIRTQVILDKYIFLKENLSKEDCKILKIDGLPIGRLYDMMKQYKSVKKLVSYLMLFRRNKVPVFTIRMLNPVIVYRAIKKRK